MFLAIGYAFYFFGLTTNDVSLRDSGIPIENFGVILMVAGGFLYLTVVSAKKIFK
ncbi:MAG: hypothetical protein V1703_05005 [Candidatus Altiarchaeota archaeon]